MFVKGVDRVKFGSKDSEQDNVSIWLTMVQFVLLTIHIIK